MWYKITEIAIADHCSCPVPLKKTVAASWCKSWCKNSSRKVVSEKVKKSWLINHHLPSTSYQPTLYFASNVSLSLVHRRKALEDHFSNVFPGEKRIAFEMIALRV